MSTKRLYDKLDDLDQRLDGIEIILVKQEANLQTHMKRSEALESIIAHLKENEIKPLNKFKDRSEGALKLIGIVAVLVTTVSGIIAIFKYVF